MRPEVKICGLKKPADAQYVNDAGADYAGFVFYEKSRRNLSRQQAEEIMKKISPRIKKVAVTVSPDAAQIKTLQQMKFDIIQMHGKLSEDAITAAELPVWYAINLSDPEEFETKTKSFFELPEELQQKITAIVVDGAGYGGGQRFDWQKQLNIDRQAGIFAGRKFVLAGGLHRGCKFRSGRKRSKRRSIDKTICNMCQRGSRRKERKMNKKAYYGQFGGQYVAESLMNTLQELDQAYEEAIHDPEFMKQYHYYLKQYVGRETPLYYAERLSAKYGTKIYLKREDLNHTGAHKINNVIGQILLAKRMGKTKVIAETGAGQHGVATATGAALFDMECTVYMGKEDIQRQKLNVMRMEMLGAKVVSVESGSNTLKDATNEAIRTWAKTAEDTFYIIGSAVGPYPYPKMVKEFQSVISREAKRQHMEAEGKNPDVVMACVGGGSNSIGMFADFIDEPEVELIGVEAAGLGIETGKHASAMALGEPGVLHGMRSYLLQDTDGNIQLAHSISAGLDYPGVGPEHAYLRDTGRAKYVAITDVEAMDALMELCKLEGIIPAIESAHAVAYAFKKAKEMTMDQSMIICLSGRGDKDVNTIADYLDGKGYLN